MEKKKIMKSQRYRFWRNAAILLASMLLGGLIGYFGESFHFGKGVDISQIISRPLVYSILAVLSLLFFGVAMFDLYRSKGFMKDLEQTDDEDLASSTEVKGNLAYARASMILSCLLVPYFLVINYFGNTTLTGSQDERSLALLLFILVAVPIISGNFMIRRGYKVAKGQEIPRNVNAKEMSEFLVESMDEVEKQINYKGNFEMVMSLKNRVFPVVFVLLILLSFAFQVDITLAFLSVGAIYLYIMVYQYKISKRYYK